MHVAPRAKQLDSCTSFPLNVISCSTHILSHVGFCVPIVAHLLWSLETHQCPTFAYISNTQKKLLMFRLHGFGKQNPCRVQTKLQYSLKLFLEYWLTFCCARPCPRSCERTKLSGSQTVLMSTAELPKDRTVW